MSQHPPHDHQHAADGHSHDHETTAPSATHLEASDLSIPDSELTPRGLNRRNFLRGTGILGAGAAAASVLSSAYPAAAASTETGAVSRSREQNGGYLWLSGDHHIHTQYSSDAQYRVSDQVRHASQNGLDWMVITDHGSVAHAKLGVDKVNPEIKTARSDFPDTLVYQGFEWNIPGAEHGTVFVSPGPNEVAVLKQFENSYDGVVNNAGSSTPANEALAVSGLAFLSQAVRQRMVPDALMLANHPARKGIDSPHELRGWRDTAPGIAVGMEGAPGHQAAGIAAPNGAGGGRGEYDFSPSPDSFAGYPLESYRTWGGFDWFTATVGGLWDSMLAEGKPWWITANSDSHKVYGDWSVNPVGNVTSTPWDPAGDTFDSFGRYGDPIYGGVPLQTGNSDFWPGYFSRTHVGSTFFGYDHVMAGIRAGRIWVGHGDLIAGLDMRVRVNGNNPGAPLGAKLAINAGDTVDVFVNIKLQDGPNFAQFLPQLAKVDLIVGDILGPNTDRDAFTTPNTKVVKTWDTSGRTGTITLKYSLGKVDHPVYVRLRGSDGKRSAPGYLGTSVDPSGPAIDVVGDADPWADLWFYSNPIFVVTPSPLPYRKS